MLSKQGSPLKESFQKRGLQVLSEKGSTLKILSEKGSTQTVLSEHGCTVKGKYLLPLGFTLKGKNLLPVLF